MIRNSRREIERLCEIFGRQNVYIELQRHFDRQEEARNHAAVRVARSLGLPVVATNGVSYALPGRRAILDVFAEEPGVPVDIVGGKGGARTIRRAIGKGAMDGHPGEIDAPFAPPDRVGERNRRAAERRRDLRRRRRQEVRIDGLA